MSNLYLKAISQNSPTIIPTRRVKTIGRSESCDITIHNDYLSFVHAAIVISGDSILVTDLKSTNGIYLNDEVSKSIEAKLGDRVSIASINYVVELSEETAGAETVGESTQTILRRADVIKKLSRDTHGLNHEGVATLEEKSILEMFPSFEFTEFIFEENIKGKVFKERKKEKAVEISILFGNLIHSVQYFEKKDKSFEVTSAGNKEHQQKIFLPLISLINDREIIKHHKKKFYIQDNFDEIDLFRNGKVEEVSFSKLGFELIEGDFIRAKIDKAIVYLSLTFAPPTLVGYSTMMSDKLLASLVVGFISLWIALSGFLIQRGVQKVEVAPRVIDRILYVKPPRVSVAPTTTTTLPSSSTTLPQANKPSPSAASASSAPVIVKPKVVKVKKQIKKMRRKLETKSDKIIVKKSESLKTSETSKVETNLKQKTDLLKNKYAKYLDSSTSKVEMSNEDSRKDLLNSNFNNLKTKTNSKLIQADSSKIRDSQVKVGSLSNSQNVSTTGFNNVSKVSDMFGGRTVVLGLIDPNLVKRLLKQNSPRFSYCYEKELERKKMRKSNSIIVKFTIYQGGVAKDISIDAKSFPLSARGINCFQTVLKRIQFPSPKGGGTVGITQPFHMEPKF